MPRNITTTNGNTQRQQQQQQPHHNHTQQQHIHPYNSRPEPPLKQIMNLKVLYTLDDTTTYLGRSSKPILIRLIDLPGSTIRIGAVDLKKCLQIVLQSSPELISDDHDFSCYSKDISEPDEPYVGHGMVSTLKDKKGENLIPGRICTSFASLLGGSNSNETLEVKLKLLKVYKRNNSFKRCHSDEFEQQQQQQQQQEQANNDSTSSENEEDTFTAPTGKYYKRLVSKRNKPIKASRTKSLPTTYHRQQQHLLQQQHIRQFTNLNNNYSHNNNNNNNSINKKPMSIVHGQRMNSIAGISTHGMNSSPIAELAIFQEPKKIKLDDKRKTTTTTTTCLECGTHESKTWKVIKTPSPQLQFRTGVLCNDCNASNLLNGVYRTGRPPIESIQENHHHNHHNHHQINHNNYSSSPSINNLNNVDINEIFSAEYDVSRFGGPLTDIDPLPQQQQQQLTPVDEPPKLTRLNTTLIDMEEDKENIRPISRGNSPNKPISLMVGCKQTEFEKILLESFHEFNNTPPLNNSPNIDGNDDDDDNNKNSNGWVNVLFSDVEEEEEEEEVKKTTEIKQNDDNNKNGKTPIDSNLQNKTGTIASSPPMGDYKDEEEGDEEEDERDKLHTSILTSINDEINSLTNWNKYSPPTSVLADGDGDDDENVTEDEKL